MTDDTGADESDSVPSPEAIAAAADALVRRLPAAPTAPLSTYRVQLHAGFTFRDATRIVPYLAELGIGALYSSPFLKAHPGSTHGYDVVDYNALNPEIGTEEDFDRLVAALREHGMGLLVDFVPNHMGIAGGANAWWQDVLENGQASPHAEFFDIDWAPLQSAATGKVVLPVLGDHYGAVLEKGALQLRHEEGAFTVCYYQLQLPIAPPSYPLILRQPLPGLEERIAADDPHLLEYHSIITAFDRLPPQSERDPERLAERRREQVVTKRRLAELVRSSPDVAAAIDDAVRVFNGTPGEPHSFDALDALLEAQSYRLSFWRVAAEEINYRRFFAINELAGIRQELPTVFDATHALLLRFVGEGKVTGLRIDHPDGLWDPAGYYLHLQRATFAARSREAFAGKSPDDNGLERPALEPAIAQIWEERHHRQGDEQRFYLVVEKILEPGEELPPSWAVAGTVGYEFARATTGLLIDPASKKAFDDLYARFIGEEIDFHELVYEKKRLIMRVGLASEVNVLAEALNRISEQNRHTRDFTLNNLRFAVREIIACFPVYRTYAVCEEGVIHATDRRYIDRAVALAKRRNPASDPLVFDFVRDILLLHGLEQLTDEQRDQRCRFGMKFQQLTGPVMAKGLEDTALYIDNRLVAMNEVGGDPTSFGVSVEGFHRQCLERRKRWPHALLTSSTHDTKRSEDVRARIAVLSEIPREWRTALNRWRRLNRKHKRRIEGAPAPSANDEYLLYQTLLGAWPFGEDAAGEEFVERIIAYMLKAAREAQVETSWINPNVAYEDALSAFVRAVLDSTGANPFLDDFATLRRKVARAGALNALSPQLLKLMAPGAPDIYQGTDLWDFSLVDPDNRRPVDYALRTRALRALRRRRVGPRLAADLLETVGDGRIKLYVTQRALTYRQENPALFLDGDYVPLAVTGARSVNVVAFARRLDEQEVIIVVPRLTLGVTKGEDVTPLGEAWGDTRLTLPDTVGTARYRNAFTDEIVLAQDAHLRVADVFAAFPVALLVRLSDIADGAPTAP
ncbi:MAG: (1-_4)-alpha-D-glucan 1-alpha-D-glucosylmutase [Thermomicrobiales bacterium]|nr:(1->4)-alpha-D-glucan 1-alpha-D-glucosylmutase [Thermomicrobiales bacterium]